MEIKDILIWLGIFIVGSLVVGFLVNPQSFQNFRENFNDELSIKEESGLEGIRLIPSEMEEYGFFKEWHKSCAAIETLGESEGVRDLKQKVCRESCGKRNLDYLSHDCERDLLVCYCID
jgi:hypothetical protein